MSSRGRSEKRAFLILFLVVAVVLGAATYNFLSNNQGSASNTSGPAGTHVYTWSVNLTIQIYTRYNNTITIPIPSHIGQQSGLWVNHTLDDYGTPGVTAPIFTTVSLNDSSVYDGFVYISPTRYGHTFTLADFFNIWGQSISNTCIQVPGYPRLCDGSQGILYMEVNTAQVFTYGAHAFLGGEVISIIFFES